MEDKLLQLELKSIIYTTHSHTAESPRFRVVLAVDKPILPRNYPAVCSAVANYLGIEKYVDTSCFNPARRYFEPRCSNEHIDHFLFKEIEGEPLNTTQFLSDAKINETHTPIINRHKELTPLGLSLLKADADNISQVEHQLGHIDANCDYERWRNTIWAILSTGWDCAVPTAREWSESAPYRFEEQAFINVVKSFDPTKEITLRTLNHYAKESGWQPKTDIFQHKPDRFNFRTSAELQSLPALASRIKGILPERGLCSIYGQSGSGKSFLVLDLLARIATGEDFFGHKVNPCPVVYVALEGKGGIAKRIQAWEQHHMKKLPSTFRIILDQLSLFNSDATVFAEAINEKNLGGVIVIDTLNQSAPEADENKSQDMGAIVANAQTLQRLTNSLVILIHHTGKDASRGLRGHSSLIAALDVAIEVSEI